MQVTIEQLQAHLNLYFGTIAISVETPDGLTYAASSIRLAPTSDKKMTLVVRTTRDEDNKLVEAQPVRQLQVIKGKAEPSRDSLQP